MLIDVTGKHNVHGFFFSKLFTLPRNMFAFLLHLTRTSGGVLEVRLAGFFLLLFDLLSIFFLPRGCVTTITIVITPHETKKNFIPRRL